MGSLNEASKRAVMLPDTAERMEERFVGPNFGDGLSYAHRLPNMPEMIRIPRLITTGTTHAR